MPAESQYEVVPQHENPQHDGGAERPGSRQGRATRQALAFRAVSIALATTAMVVLCFGVWEEGAGSEGGRKARKGGRRGGGMEGGSKDGREAGRQGGREGGLAGGRSRQVPREGHHQARGAEMISESSSSSASRETLVGVPSASRPLVRADARQTMLFRARREKLIGPVDPRTGKLYWFAQSLRVLVLLVLPVRTWKRICLMR
jgi:hypothetical protein